MFVIARFHGTDCMSNTATEESVSMLLQAHVLETRMAEACVLRPSTRAITGVACSGASVWAEFKGPQCRDRTARDVVNPGCISKLITGALARELLSTADAADPEFVATMLGFETNPGSAGITLRHLLDHTHGFDTSEITTCPRAPSGRVDKESLRDRLLCAAKIGRPGQLHSYSNASAWLVAAAVEQYCQTDLATLICHHLFSVSEREKLPWLTRPTNPGAPFCAATGEGMEFSPTALLSFLSSFWAGNHREHFLHGQSATSAVPLPGWSGAEQGIFWGWKTYASGWFGHNSSHPGAYGLVRVQPAERIALFAFSNDLSCNAIAAGLFGRVSPSLAPARIPRLLSSTEGAPRSSYTGLYEVATMAVFIEQSDERHLTLRAHGKTRGLVCQCPFFEASLRAATDHFFYTEPRHADLFPYVQFVRPLNNGDSYLWNGKFLWRRVSGYQGDMVPQNTAPC
jgi:hypothetical protein